MTGSPIRARHAPWATWLLARYLDGAIARQFHAWYLRSDEAPERVLADGPLLYLPNHSSWWDGFVGFVLAQHWQQRFHVMMQLDQLQQHHFFSRVGAFSIDRSSAESVQADLAHTAQILRSGEAVWLFPQGALLPPHAPLRNLATGAARLAIAVPETRLVPVAIRLIFRHQPKPELFIRVGRSVMIDSEKSEARALTVRIEQALGQTLQALDEDLLQGAPGYQVLRSPRKSWRPA